MTVEQIEAMQFKEINFVGRYKFKKVQIVSPLQNVANLTFIEGNYYKKVSDVRDSIVAVQPPIGRRCDMVNDYFSLLFGGRKPFGY